MAQGGTRINHLMFNDNCILFCSANVTEGIKLYDILNKYEKGFGQYLNKHKSSFFFSSNTRERDMSLIIQAASQAIYGSYEKCLGLPAMVGRSKFNTCRGIKD